MPRHLGFSDSVNLAISLCLTYVLCVSCVRLYIRKGALGVDDLVIAIATLFSFGHTAADYVALANGLGKPWAHIVNNESVSSLNDASIVGVIAWIIALYLSKCAMICFLSRITKNPSQLILYHISNAITATLGLISLLTVTIDCVNASDYYWAFHANRFTTCPSQTIRWQVVTAFDIVSEMLLLVLPVHLVAGLQMKLQKKLVIIAAFYLRLPSIGLSIGRNYYTLQLRLPGTDYGLDSGLVVIWLEVQLAYALAAGTLSASKAFTESFNSDFGLGFTRGKGEDNYDLSNVSAKTPSSSKDEKSRNDSALESGASDPRIQSFPPDTLSKSQLDFFDPIVTPIPASDSRGSLHLKLRPDIETGNSYTQVSAEHGAGTEPWRDHSSSASDVDGQDMFIMRETAYEIQHDQAPFLRRTDYDGSK